MKKPKDINYNTGWDYFSPHPGTKEKMFCRVCKSEMNVERNIQGASSWAESLSITHGISKGHLFDRFSCPNSGESWHNQALAILQKAEDTPSKTVEEILKKEAKEIIENKKTTKSNYKEW